MTDQEILEGIRPLVQNGHLACKDALELAAKLQIKATQIGRVCDQNEIRIINCQLGCFGLRKKGQ